MNTNVARLQRAIEFSINDAGLRSTSFRLTLRYIVRHLQRQKRAEIFPNKKDELIFKIKKGRKLIFAPFLFNLNQPFILTTHHQL
jgi:hypothetical protein